MPESGLRITEERARPQAIFPPTSQTYLILPKLLRLGRPGRQSVRVTKPPLGLAMLLGLLCLVTPAAHAAPAGSGDTAVSARASYLTLGTADWENRLFARTNARRAAHGCRPLHLDSALALAARRHSSMMSSESELSHRLADETGLVERAVSAGYTHWRLLAENLAWGQSTPREAFHDWVQSPGHRANLDNCRLRDVGIGVVFSGGRPWVTQDFGRHLS